MKRLSALMIVLLAIQATSFAQDKKGYIGISLGSSIPTGDFASTDIDNDAAGWATTGAAFDISFAYKLGEGNFGLSALLRGQFNSIDVDALANEFANEFPNILWTVESDGWGIGGFMFGGYGSFPISDKLTFDTRIMFGFLNASSPEMTVTGSGPGGNAWVKQSSADATSLAYLFGVGYKYDVAEKVCILVNIDYLGAKPEFSGVETTDSFGGRDIDTWSQTFGSVNISGGVGLRI